MERCRISPLLHTKQVHWILPGACISWFLVGLMRTQQFYISFQSNDTATSATLGVITISTHSLSTVQFLSWWKSSCLQTCTVRKLTGIKHFVGSGFCSIQVFAKLATASNNATAALALRQSFPKQELIGLCRDLRGIASAISGRRQYSKSASLILSLLVWSQHRQLEWSVFWLYLDQNHRKNQQNEMALHHLVALLIELENSEFVTSLSITLHIVVW